MPSETGVNLSDPSPYVAGVLRQTDWHEINACIAPRPCISRATRATTGGRRGYDRVIATLKQAFGLYDQAQAFQHVRDLRSHSMTPFIPELAPWIERQLSQLPASSAAPAPCHEPHDPIAPCCGTLNGGSLGKPTPCRPRSLSASVGKNIAARWSDGSARRATCLG